MACLLGVFFLYFICINEMTSSFFIVICFFMPEFVQHVVEHMLEDQNDNYIHTFSIIQRLLIDRFMSSILNVISPIVIIMSCVSSLVYLMKV